MEFKPSKYQQAIFDRMESLYEDGTPNLGVIARAGSGKTTTLVKGLNYIPASMDSVFCAFNKSIQLELAERLPKFIESRTFHSMGFANLRSVYKRINVNNYKATDIYEHMNPKPDKYATQDEKEEYYELRSAFLKAFSLGRNNLINFKDNSQIWGLLEGMDLSGYEPTVADMLPEAHRLDLNNTSEIDFDDMISMPLYLGMNLRQYDLMAVDEAQDLNLAQIDLVLKSLKPDGKAVLVGDPKQSIYGFRGADQFAMERLISATKATQLPLSITYRCPIKVVKLANQFVPDLEYREGAPDGIVETLAESRLYQLIQPKDMILCRVNAPLVGMAFSFIRQGIKATIMGKDLGKSLATLAKKVSDKSHSMQDVYSILYDMKMHEVEKILNNRFIRNPEAKIDRVNDKYATMEAIADNCQMPYEFPVKAEALFDDTTDGIVLSTVHKAKGLEAHRVFILNPELMPHPRAKGEAAMAQETNLIYVAITRSKSELYFIDKTPLWA